MATYYLVHHPDGNAHRFPRYEDARKKAFQISRITGRGVSVTRHPEPYKATRSFFSLR